MTKRREGKAERKGQEERESQERGGREAEGKWRAGKRERTVRRKEALGTAQTQWGLRSPLSAEVLGSWKIEEMQQG